MPKTKAKPKVLRPNQINVQLFPENHVALDEIRDSLISLFGFRPGKSDVIRFLISNEIHKLRQAEKKS